MSHAILITQCLQNDFVKPIGRFDPLPNSLHIGFDEARRLMGENMAEGPVALTMQFAYQQSAYDLSIIHIRDWHDPDDPFQAEHIRQFGEHCFINTPGAEFAFPITNTKRPVVIIDSPGLNDFVGTNLDAHLAPFKEIPVRVGLMGVWTEAKISYLAYDLRSRYPAMELAVCSALTASSSRAHHFMALEQLSRLLGVRIFSSIGEFTNFLSGKIVSIPLPTPAHTDFPKLVFENEIAINETDNALIRYLFRDCKEVKLRVLDGGFSGNVVLGSDSIDLHGHHQAPHVIKIGEQTAIGQERAAFERIEAVLGNNAPRITDFADLKERGILKYRYAAMGGGFSTTFQKLYCDGLASEDVARYLHRVFGEQLNRFYVVADLERINLLDYYAFSPQWADSVRDKVETIIGTAADGATIQLPHGPTVPNIYQFYAHDLEELLPLADTTSYLSYIHGDLNGANIIIDARDNVWLIDFFHTHRGHVLKDLIKFENDLLYIFTAINNAEDLAAAIQLSNILVAVEDLGRPLPNVDDTGLTHPEIRRAYKTVCLLRSFYPALLKEDRNPIQLLVGQIRYAVHTLAFDESNTWQKEWALYMACICAAKLKERLKERGPLRVDWLDEQYTGKGKLGLTLLPGRRDYNRSLRTDIIALKTQGVSHVVTLVTVDEFAVYGVDTLLETYQESGFKTYHLPILDQSVSSEAEMEVLVAWLTKHLNEGANILVHCVGGLGRSGLVAGCYLKTKGLSTEAAIAEVRRARSLRAIETKGQEKFVGEFGK